jgi:hypothetical protein
MSNSKLRFWFSVYVILLANACIASPEQDKPITTIGNENSFQIATNSVVNNDKNKPSEASNCGIDTQFKQAILKNNFSIKQLLSIEKSSIPNIADNIKSIRKLFKGKETVFDAYSTLDRYTIKSSTSKISFNLYCFQFNDSQLASSWFDTLDKLKSTGIRTAILSRPKKIVALANNKIFVIEGYHISSFKSLHFILDQIPNKQSTLSPEHESRFGTPDS